MPAGRQSLRAQRLVLAYSRMNTVTTAVGGAATDSGSASPSGTVI
jgi:hypothetical protein